jgi:hypothetical protein
MVRAGVLTPNEMRLAEGWPAMEGGEELVPKRSAAGSRISPTAPRTPPRPQRWTAAVATLIDLQDDYRTWLDNLPPNLEGSRLAEKLQANHRDRPR